MKNTRGKRLNQYIKNYVVFDLETTGIRQNVDEIIEISALRVRDHQISNEFTTLVNPGMHIPSAATAVNNITDEMVKDAPKLADVMESFLSFIGNDVLVGHNIHTFDMNFIHRASLMLYETEIKNDYIDTLYMARKCVPELSHHRLSDMADHFHISTQGAHRALNDCRMNQKIYEELGKIMAQKFSSGNEMQPEVCCPNCGAPMIRRKGKYGEFYGCSDFPRCRGTRRI